jgi:carbon storage regulator CsrA
MLALSRKDGETVVIGDVTIGIQQAKRGKVRIWIDAPAGQPIRRGELLELPRMASADALPDLVEPEPVGA